MAQARGCRCNSPEYTRCILGQAVSHPGYKLGSASVTAHTITPSLNIPGIILG